jgi:hypothetical protein
MIARVLLVVLALALCLVGYQYQLLSTEAARLRSQLLTDSTNAARVLTERNTLRIQLDEAQRDRLEARNSQSEKASKTKITQEASRDALDAARAKMMADPRYVALQGVRLKVAVAMIYADFLRTLRLPPQQMAALKEAMINGWLMSQDMQNLAKAQGIDEKTDPAGYAALKAKIRATNDDEIRAIIGDAGLARYREFPQTASQRMTTDILQASLSYTDAPLTETQAAQMNEVLKTQELDPSAKDLGRTPVTESTLERAAVFLSPPQMQELRDMRASQLAQQELAQMEEEAKKEANKGP